MKMICTSGHNTTDLSQYMGVFASTLPIYRHCARPIVAANRSPTRDPNERRLPAMPTASFLILIVAFAHSLRKQRNEQD